MVWTTLQNPAAQAIGKAAEQQWDDFCVVQRLQCAKGADLSEVTGSPAMDGGIPPGGGPRRVTRPAEEGGEGALAAAKEAPTLLWGCPVMTPSPVLQMH